MQSIELAGKNYPISFGFGALMEYERSTGSPVTALFAQFAANEAKISDLAELIACGLTNGARKAGDGSSYKVFRPGEVADMLDETPNPMEAVTAAMELLAASFAPIERIIHPCVPHSPA